MTIEYFCTTTSADERWDSINASGRDEKVFEDPDYRKVIVEEGSMAIFTTREAAEEFVAGDPFVQRPGREVREVPLLPRLLDALHRPSGDAHLREEVLLDHVVTGGDQELDLRIDSLAYGGNGDLVVTQGPNGDEPGIHTGPTADDLTAEVVGRFDSDDSGLGFVSGHAVVAVAFATVVHPYLRSRTARVILWTAAAIPAGSWG